MANIENLKPFTKDNASYYGRRGGIASGRTRKRKAYLKRQFEAYMNVSNYISSLDDTEYNDFISDFTEAEQEEIQRKFRPTKQQQKEVLKQFKFR